MFLKKLLALGVAVGIVMAPNVVQAYDGTALAPNVSRDMVTSTFWNNRNPRASQVLMSPEEIAFLNKKMKSLDSSLTGFRDLESIPTTFNGPKLIEACANLDRKRELYIDGEAVNDAWFDSIEENIRSAEVSENEPIKYGIITTRTVIKQMPVSKMASDSPTDPEWDDLCDSALRVGDPVVVYYISGDGKFAYIMSEIGPGFIPVTDVGICSDVLQWKDVKTHEDFIVVTGGKVYLEASSAFPESSEKMLTMGTVLELSKDKKSTAANRTPWNSYVVNLPYRKDDGSLGIGRALIPANRDVNVGFLPLTSRGIVDQAFKCLGNRYGWGGMLKSDDCSQFVMNVYKCFGLEIPRNTTWQANMPVKKYEVSKMSPMEKTNLLSRMLPGTIVQFPGHEMIFLGVVNGKVYTINDVSSMADPEVVYTDQESLPTGRIRSVIVNEMGSTRRRNTQTWLEAMVRLIDPFSDN